MKLISTKLLIIFWAMLLFFSGSASAVGLRSFFTVPTDKGDYAFRFSDIHNFDIDTNTLELSAAYGVTANNALFLSAPIRLLPDGAKRTGDVSVLWRYNFLQYDAFKLGVLGGGFIPTNSASDGALQVGTVATYFINRHQFDSDFLFKEGFGSTLNAIQYDISWQYRLWPAKTPKWGSHKSLNTVVEYNGRWLQGSHVNHQATVGLQLNTPRWAVEAGVFRGINSPDNFSVIVSLRLYL